MELVAKSMKCIEWQITRQTTYIKIGKYSFVDLVYIVEKSVIHVHDNVDENMNGECKGFTKF